MTNEAIDELTNENRALRSAIEKISAEVGPLRVVHASLPDLPATHRLHRIALRIVAALAESSR